VVERKFLPGSARRLELGTVEPLSRAYTGGNAALVRQYAAELSVLALDVVLVAGGAQVGPLQQVTRTLPIVFVGVSDAVGAGFVESLARLGGNATGFTHFCDENPDIYWLEKARQLPGELRPAHDNLRVEKSGQ
jgi:ABC transporter substrate binding protein